MRVSNERLSSLMKKAWGKARVAVKRFGGTARQYFAEALKAEWARISSEVRKIKLINKAVKSLGSFENVVNHLLNKTCLTRFEVTEMMMMKSEWNDVFSAYISEI